MKCYLLMLSIRVYALIGISGVPVVFIRDNGCNILLLFTIGGHMLLSVGMMVILLLIGTLCPRRGAVRDVTRIEYMEKMILSMHWIII